MKNFNLAFLLIVFVTSINAQNYNYGKVSKEEVLESTHPTNPEANAAILFKSSKTYYDYSKNKGFILTTDVHERIKIYNKDGFEWATKEISLYNSGSDQEDVISIKGETYNVEEGKLVSQKLGKEGMFEEKVSKHRNKEKITMPALKEGSVIEYKYTIVSPFIYSIDKMELQYTIPIEKLEAQVAIPEYFFFNKHTNPKSKLGFNIQESQKRTSHTSSRIDRSVDRVVNHSTNTSKFEYSENIYSIEKENIPALKKEEYVDYLKNYAASLSWELLYTKFPSGDVVNYSETWDNVVDKIYKNSEFGKELSETNYYDDDLDEVLKGKSLQVDKMNAIFQFVKDKVKWNSYVGYYTDNGVRDAYKEGNGNTADINIMLTSMLRYAKLDANPILISTKDNGIPIYPTRSGFNYIVASVNLNDEVIILDASQKYNVPGMLPDFARNWLGRLVREDGTSEWINLMSKMHSDNKTILNLKIEDDFKISGKVTNIFNGYFAKDYRDEKLGLNMEDHIRNLEEDKTGIEISDVTTKNTEKLDDYIWESYNFKSNDGVEQIAENLYFSPLFFMKTATNPFKAEDRTYPIFLKYPSKISNTVNIIIPDNYEVESIPENIHVTLKENGGSFKFLIVQNGKFLRIDTELLMNTIVYLPEDYETLKSFYNMLVEKNLETIVLKKTS